MSVSLYLRQQGPPVSQLHPDEDDGTVFVFSSFGLCGPQRAAHCGRSEQGVGPGYKPLNKPRAFGRQVHQRDSNIPQPSSVGPHTLKNTLTAQANHLAIFQVNVKHQLVWWSDSQKPTGGLNLITLERRANEIVAGATSVGGTVTITSERADTCPGSLTRPQTLTRKHQRTESRERQRPTEKGVLSAANLRPILHQQCRVPVAQDTEQQ